MSSKRKTTKPTRLCEDPVLQDRESDLLAFNHIHFTVQDPPVLEGKSLLTDTSKFLILLIISLI